MSCTVDPTISQFGSGLSSGTNCLASPVLYLLYNISCSQPPSTPTPTPTPSLPAPVTVCSSTGGKLGTTVRRQLGSEI
jgi:hypothetical protein